MFGVALYSTNTHVCTMLTGFLDTVRLFWFCWDWKFIRKSKSSVESRTGNVMHVISLTLTLTARIGRADSNLNNPLVFA